jgi:hypothetical protein
MFNNNDFANYRNLARRAQSSGHVDDEVRYLRKCVDIYEFRKGVDCTPQTFLDLIARLNSLTTPDGRRRK